MATTTTRLALRKPAGTDLVNVSTDLDANYDLIDAVVGFTNCTSTTRPSAPFTGQGIRESDTGAALVSNGSGPASASWTYLHGTGGSTTVGATGATAALRIQTTGTISGNRCVDFRKSGDANASFIQDFDGKMQWGPGGSGGPDVNLYRSTVGTLKTDQSLLVAGNVSVSGSAAITGNTNISGNITIAGNGVTKPLAGVLVTSAPNLGVTSGTTELNLAKLALAPAALTVTSGRFYALCLMIEGNASVANDQFQFQVRYGTALSGTSIASWRFQVANVTAFNDSKFWSVPWQCPSTDAAAKFYISVLRSAGTGTFTVTGGGRCAFWLEDMGADVNVWSTT
jgi:hypothetical protein